MNHSKKRIISFVLVTGLFFSCKTINYHSADAKIKNEIQKQLDKCVLAVATKDIDMYMDLIPEDFIIKDKSGEIISREKQREYALRDWSVIDKTLHNHFVVDSIVSMGDSVLAYTSQRWERIMFRPDGINKDTVLTTQKHIETWKKINKRWLNYEVEELGGSIYINGKLYNKK